MTFRFIISLILLSLATSRVFSSNETDHQALLSFKASITEDPFGALSSWNYSIHFCHWNGVTCSRRREKVTALNLTRQHLGGTLSPHIGNLSFLRAIDLYQNNIRGSIPNDIGRLFRLQYLNLEANYFEGRFPTNLSHCVDMKNINMNHNKIHGKLPSDFASWPKLDSFSLSTNQFTGSIPPSIGNVSSLRILYLYDNIISGGIPLEVSLLAKLEALDLSGNYLVGIVHPLLYNLSSLAVISLALNQLEGTLPADMGFTLPKLGGFVVGGNRFSGLIPPSIANASHLVYFDIPGNNFTGPIPNNLGSLSKLQVLSLGQNSLGDNMRPGDLSFLDSLVNCTRLRVLAFDDNNLGGKFPNSIVNLSTTMEKLGLYGNHIYGSIPREIGKLKNMNLLAFANNFLTGTIPESIGELSKLGGLDLGINNISGVIPTSFSNMTQLLYLGLDGNTLQGSIPTELFNISTLQTLALGNNRLRGEIPEAIVSSSQCFSLDLSNNLLTGPLPSNIGLLKQLVQLSVSNNKLTGGVPAALGECVMLEELYMAENLFQGKIPPSFKALKSLRILDLSSNNISGGIPIFFDKFHQIEYLNLSHNELGGEVPRERLFSNNSAFSVVGNLELCGGIQALHLPACPVKVTRNKKKKFGMRIILIVVLGPIGTLLGCLSLIFIRRRNSKKLIDPVPVLKDDQYLRLSYQDLLLATNEFSPNNLVGKGRYGSVYRGVLAPSEHIVAVKVLNVEVRGANKSFLAECETLRNIRHRNLIKIITACSSTDFKGNDFKALVFEFMTNGSLDTWLHPSPSEQGNGRNLTLLERLNISIDVAMGVDYLHHHSHASIIHSDIKPSNILLDKDFVAHIGDFGLARFSLATTGDINQAHLSSTGIRGTVGYVPPEYGMCGEISAEGDVYSYGILLLEIFSGKRPTESSILIDNDNNLHDFVRKALPERLMDIADPRIILDQEHGMTGNLSYNRASMELCLASIFEVGILCSEETPRKRIDISVAIKQLHAARETLLQSRH
ncbi:hypothetical protein DCAR_0104878 [Daucus carota subsp. sativus]|uniref:non-specific serine/threonine protein kinase n=1 Tax=Daucus carota subsp. sativus TaxID=79200 RepID=A0AAF0W9B2_DAUCS|nr:PREDICTED: probable LRR receptor-like serine/threonine-protein kinase At3g47570 [Daucus carota subsp. sativus]WOG85687.1 hypothetical protein DCAR_0104878 [Daucus carota subsp. sativus]